MHIRPLALGAGLLFVLLAACGDDGTTERACIPGDSKSCACTDGREGAQVCSEDGSGYGSCACEGSPPTDAGIEEDAGGEIEADGGETGDAPIILSLSRNITEMTQGDTLTVLAIVTDPDGLDDIIGGVLEDASGENTYGPFASTADEGAYEATLDWNTLQRHAPIDAPSGGITRTLRVRFFDEAGNEVTRETSIDLVCTRRTDGICDGTCADFQTSRFHCGGCDQPTVSNSRCLEGAVVCDDEHSRCGDACVRLMYDENHCGECERSCDALTDGLEITSVRALCLEGACTFTARTDTPFADCDTYCRAIGGLCNEGAYASTGDCAAETGCAEYTGPGCVDELRTTTTCAENFPEWVSCGVDMRGEPSAMECACTL